MSRIVQPSVDETAFNCPHCSAFTTQHWYDLHAKEINGEQRLPFVGGEEFIHSIAASIDSTQEEKASNLVFIQRLNTGLVFFDEIQQSSYRLPICNLHLSKCFNCGKFSVWVHNRLLFPATKAGAPPNPDLPKEIAADFEEARDTVNASARGAAALLRLCVQNLCKHLGEKGDNIDQDIASLVKKGLNPLIQKSLDIVRVIGNESVHPGVIDLRDDRDTAIRLFDLVNAIAQQMISQPKMVDEMYSKLPETKRKAIEKRDGK